jgi:methyl-accepting chemotaxis protein
MIKHEKVEFSIAKKLTLFGVVILVVLLITTIAKYNAIGHANTDFMLLKEKAMEGKIKVLEIGKAMNYISRCTRDIMLGNAYDKNIAKIEKNRTLISQKFDELLDTVKDTPNQMKKEGMVRESKASTMAFIDDGYTKMKSLEHTQRTPKVLADMYQAYKRDATPLAQKSRTAFSKIAKMKDIGLTKQSQNFIEDMATLKQLIVIESLVVVILIMSYLIFLSRNITTSLSEFQLGLESFFDFLNKKRDSINSITISSKDEFGLMAKLVNQNISNIKVLIEDEHKLIEETSVVIERVKHGWYSETINLETHNPTLNRLKSDVNTMIEATKYHFESINQVLGKYSNYDYREQLELQNVDKGGVFEILVQDINALREAINTMLVDNRKNGLTLQKSADLLLNNVQTLSSSSQESATFLTQTTAGIEDITTKIAHNSTNVVKMAGFANEVTGSVAKGQKLATQTTTAMDEINTKVNAINDSITVIDQIAFQTNILSLNAAVEAATAGESGKGFAVVAQEVRNLASRSSEAANEIKSLVENATQKANDGKLISDQMIDGYSSLNESISKTLELIKEVEVSSKEQESSANQIHSSISLLNQQINQNAEIATKTKEIANKTQNIAINIVNDTEQKEFNGKEKIKV